MSSRPALRPIPALRATANAAIAAIAVMTATAGCGPEPRMGTDGVDQLRQWLSVCPGAETVPGIDVSHWNGAIDWGLVADAGVRWAYAKATESTSYSDPTFETHWAGMKGAGVLRGAYHFFHPDVDGRAQALAYLEAVGELEPGDLPPMLDWESTTAVSGAVAASRAQDFIDEVRAATGRTTLVYTSPGLWARFGIPTSFDAQPLWVAHFLYCTSGPGCCPTVPSGWTSWAAWQWSDQGRVPGIPDSEVDLDLFNGTLDELRALSAKSERDGGSSGTGTGTGDGDGGARPDADGGGAGGGSASDGGPDGGADGGAVGAARPAPVVGGCGCGVADGPAWWVLALGALARRRRRASGRSTRYGGHPARCSTPRHGPRALQSRLPSW